MNARVWAAIESMIEQLREIARAERSDWLKIAHAIEALPVVKPGSPVPHAIQLLAAAAKGVVRQMPHCGPLNEVELRGVAMALANVLQNDVASTITDADRPYWNSGDR